MKKISWKEKLQYRFDILMSKGTIALVGMLFFITLAVVIVAGILGAIFSSDASVGNNIWLSLMHAIDAGTLAGDDISNPVFIILMSLVTVCGIFITSILIGIITTGFEEKLTALRKGDSMVVEQNHTVILGFNDNIYTLISELVIANENKKDGCIVIVDDMDKEEMEAKIAQQNMLLKTTRLICRSGNITESHSLHISSIDSCRSIIINESNDFRVIKTILSIVNFLKTNNAFDNKCHISAIINDQLNYDAAKIAGEGKVELIYTQDAISRIIAHTCRQPGLSNVLIELFDYDGEELYFEYFKELEGKTFGDALNYFENGVLFGIARNGKVLLNPPRNTQFELGDQCILLEEDDGSAKPNIKPLSLIKDIEYIGTEIKQEQPEHILILGTNEMLIGILNEMDHYVAPQTIVTIADDNIDEEKDLNQSDYTKIQLQLESCNINSRKHLESLVTNDINHIIILSDLDCEPDLSDAKTLLKLIHLRDISQKNARHFNITSEMQNTANERLAKVAKVNDFVVGNNIINLILTQISENRELTAVFEELLDEEGSEIYMKKMGNYILLNCSTDFYTITDIASRKGEVAIGYKRVCDDGSFQIVLNPPKSQLLSFTESDYLIVLALE